MTIEEKYGKEITHALVECFEEMVFPSLARLLM